MGGPKTQTHLRGETHGPKPGTHLRNGNYRPRPGTLKVQPETETWNPHCTWDLRPKTLKLQPKIQDPEHLLCMELNNQDSYQNPTEKPKIKISKGSLI